MVIVGSSMLTTADPLAAVPMPSYYKTHLKPIA